MSEIKEPLLGRRFKYNPDFKNPEMSSLALESLHRVRRKIKDGTYKFEFRPCYCGSEDSILLAEMDRYGNYYPFVLCRRCGIMRANPRLTNESYIDFYTNEYRTLYGDSDRDKEELYLSRVKQSKEVFDFISDHIKLPPNGVVFDIGCNMGTIRSVQNLKKLKV